jgi:hypothetical protein
MTYTTSIGVGNPPTDYTLVIDTGSSNTWVGAGKKYKQTSTSKGTDNDVVSSIRHARGHLSSVLSRSRSAMGLAGSQELNVRIILLPAPYSYQFAIVRHNS